MDRYLFAYGFKSFSAAQEALETAFASGDVVQGEGPEISGYIAVNGKRRWRITLLEN